jgi:hypothetical protein
VEAPLAEGLIGLGGLVERLEVWALAFTFEYGGREDALALVGPEASTFLAYWCEGEAFSASRLGEACSASWHGGVDRGITRTACSETFGTISDFEILAS